MKEPTISLLDANTLELHYWFSDETHTMDAVIQNKCEFELLGVAKEIAKAFGVEILIETEPLADGGLRRWFKIINKSEKKTAVITTAIITALLTSIIVTPITTVVSTVTEKIIEKIFEDDELKKLEKDKLKEEIENIKTDTELKKQQLSHNTIIKKRRSNFYQALENYPKVTRVSFILEDKNKTQVSDENVITKKDFNKFILVSDDLEPEVVEDSTIEIISPVLKKGDYKWKGLYNGLPISFNMKSNEFKTLAQTGQIDFNTNSSIKCALEIKKKINNEGLIEVVEYNVLRVDEYFENQKPIETSEGKHNRQKREANKRQTKLFGDTNLE